MSPNAGGGGELRGLSQFNLWRPPTGEQEHVARVEKVGHILHADVAAVRVHEQDHVSKH
jgi:hypothetical protein